MPKLPDVPKIEVQTPKIQLPDVKVPEPPKPVVKMEAPKPVILPAPPKQVVAMAAPQVVHLGAAAAVVNNSQHPAAVALGSTSNPIAPSSARVSNVNLGNRGMAGMPSSNTGMGRPTAVNLAGSGQPGGSMNGTGARGVQGVKLGVAGGTGPMNSTGRVAGPVNLAVNTPPPMPHSMGAQSEATHHSAPKVIYKPKPEYTEEAKQLHLEGTVTVHIHVLPNGAVQVVGITNGLGHGLDESAKRAVLATKFEPATDAAGHPIEWDGFVNVAFQLAG
jgi:TonB family protein